MFTELLHKRKLRAIALAISLSASLLAQSTAPQVKPENSQPDNTATNKQDQKASRPTADQSQNTKSDVQLARDIRRSVVKDKSLSVYGHNVKIIAQGGKVTLKGPVHTALEKTTIQKYAGQIAGDENVINELTVKNDSQ